MKGPWVAIHWDRKTEKPNLGKSIGVPRGIREDLHINASLPSVEVCTGEEEL